jgi:alkanesulfonate monooxygenase SsuD/methylene tetrahydromethanopterin reductase-like flavin-dependent oxidoreductase (luciferase family)
MRLSIWPSSQQPWPDVLEVARHCDTTGWDGIYLADHFMADGDAAGGSASPTLEVGAAMGAVAAATTNLRLGTLVLGNTYRHPAVVANWAATLDQISGGRVLLGIGAGWQVNEHEQYGIRLPPPGERVSMFEEACRVVRGLLDEPATTVKGHFYELHEALCEPKPVQQRLPLLIGAKGDRMLGIVAHYADEWNMWGLPEQVHERGEVLRRKCEAAGRDPGSLTWSAQALVKVTDDPAVAERFLAQVGARPAFAGTAEQFVERVAALEAVGVGEVIVPDFTLSKGQARLDELDQLRAAVSSADAA